MTTDKAAETIAFTLIEVMVALSILAIASVVLLNLQLVSIRMTDRADRMSRAATLAEAKLAEVLATGHTDIGSERGTVQDESGEAVLHWRTTVSERRMEELDHPGLAGLRDVCVEVTWNEGNRQARVDMATCAVAKRQK